MAATAQRCGCSEFVISDESDLQNVAKARQAAEGGGERVDSEEREDERDEKTREEDAGLGVAVGAEAVRRRVCRGPVADDEARGALDGGDEGPRQGNTTQPCAR